MILRLFLRSTSRKSVRPETCKMEGNFKVNAFWPTELDLNNIPFISTYLIVGGKDHRSLPIKFSCHLSHREKNQLGEVQLTLEASMVPPNS